MDRTLKLLLALASLPLIGAGLGIMISPDRFVDRLGVDAAGLVGLSTIRSVVGGVLLSSGAMILLGIRGKNTAWLLAVALVMGVLSVGRAVGLVADGFSAETVRPLVVELVLMALALVVHRRAR